MTVTAVDERLDDDRLTTIIWGCAESIRLLNIRLGKSAIPEDATEYAETLADMTLLHALATELLAARKEIAGLREGLAKAERRAEMEANK